MLDYPVLMFDHLLPLVLLVLPLTLLVLLLGTVAA